MILKVKKLSEDAKLPTRGTPQAAGWDLYSIEDKNIRTQSLEVFSTGLSIAVPVGFELQIRPRSGMAFKHQVTVLNTPGTVDSDYRGEIKIMLFNFGPDLVEIRKGDRIAQAVLNRHEVIEFESCQELPETERGPGGFGHTGS